jgi:hypothetical protein
MALMPPYRQEGDGAVATAMGKFYTLKVKLEVARRFRQMKAGRQQRSLLGL